MRLAIVADIHGNLAALEAVAADIRGRGVDRVVNLGDNLSGPLLPRETAQCLMALGWLSLAGNHDRQMLALSPGQGGLSDAYACSQLTAAEFAWLRTLPATVRLMDEIFLCHGTPRSDCDYFLETQAGAGTRLASPSEITERLAGESAPVVACGHTHIPRTVRHGEHQLILNPGSVGLQAYYDAEPAPHINENGSPDARYAILERTDHGWQTQHIALPYDHQSMAALATKRHRPDWAQALLTGYLSRS